MKFAAPAIGARISHNLTAHLMTPAMSFRTSMKGTTSAPIEVEILIADGPTFVLSPYIGSLADTERDVLRGAGGRGHCGSLHERLGLRLA